MIKSYGARIFDPITSVLEPDTLIVRQYLDNWRQSRQLQPEKRLMFAVLQDAVECFQKYAVARGHKARDFFRDTENWFFRDDHEWPFSFANICETFALDPQYMRKGLSCWKQKAIRKRFYRSAIGVKKSV